MKGFVNYSFGFCPKVTERQFGVSGTEEDAQIFRFEKVPLAAVWGCSESRKQETSTLKESFGSR